MKFEYYEHRTGPTKWNLAYRNFRYISSSIMNTVFDTLNGILLTVTLYILSRALRTK